MDHPHPSELRVDQDISLYFADLKFAPALFELLQMESTYLRPWLPWFKWSETLADTKKMIWEQHLFNQGGQKISTYISYQQRLVGMIGFIRRDKRHHIGEMGYWVAKNQQGKGIITKCCKTLMQYGFESLELNRIELRIIAGNERSLKVPPRLHFTHEGTLRQAILQGGQYQDVELFSLTKKDFNTKFLFQKV